jgi:cob(I)alamin adenosyltransferase
MKVYTKKGDLGETSLLGGTRVSKASLRIESYGTVDELNAYLGVLRDMNKETGVGEALLQIQHCLFTIGAELAVDPAKNKMEIPTLEEGDVQFLEEQIDAMTASLEPMRFFILPGGDLASSYSHVARTVCRRAERKVIALHTATEQVDPRIIAYLNRLSDYLFTLSRYFTKINGGQETPWKTRK